MGSSGLYIVGSKKSLIYPIVCIVQVFGGLTPGFWKGPCSVSVGVLIKNIVYH